MNLIPIRQLPLTFLDDSDVVPAKALSSNDGVTLEEFSQQFTDPRQRLEKLLNLDAQNMPEMEQLSLPVEPTKQPNIDWDDVPDYLHALIKYSIKYGWVTARKVKQSVRFYSGSSTDEIRSFFLAAMNAGVGITRGEGDRLQYAAILGETREGC